MQTELLRDKVQGEKEVQRLNHKVLVKGILKRIREAERGESRAEGGRDTEPSLISAFRVALRVKEELEY